MVAHDPNVLLVDRKKHSCRHCPLVYYTNVMIPRVGGLRKVSGSVARGIVVDVAERIIMRKGKSRTRGGLRSSCRSLVIQDFIENIH